MTLTVMFGSLRMSGSRSVVAYAPQTGTAIWNIDGPTDQMVASLVYDDGVLFVTGGFPELHMLGIDPRGHGNVTSTNVMWRTHKGVSYVPSPVGRLPTQVDYADYRDVAGVKLPFKWTLTWLDGKDTVELKDVRPNVAVDAGRFARPAAAAR